MPLIPDNRFDITAYPVPPALVADPSPTQMVSVVAGSNEWNVPAPPAPGSPEFDEECRTVIRVREDVSSGSWPEWFFDDLGLPTRVPSILRAEGVTEADPESASRLVDHAMDHRLDLHQVFLRSFSVRLKEPGIEHRPPAKGVDFLGVSAFDAATSWAIHAALVETFHVKYWFGQVRPELYFDTGQLISSYPCPNHPAYPAGHAAIAGATVQSWVDHVELEPADVAAIEDAGLLYAHFRTVAGVHWPSDNDAGFRLGRLVAAGRDLP